jgi:hypothetical protein
MQLRLHAGRAVQIVVMLGCYDLQCYIIVVKCRTSLGGAKQQG